MCRGDISQRGPLGVGPLVLFNTAMAQNHLEYPLLQSPSGIGYGIFKKTGLLALSLHFANDGGSPQVIGS